jgi:hypothetical protein
LAALTSAVADHRLVVLDTSVWIYHFEGPAVYGRAANIVLKAINVGYRAVPETDESRGLSGSLFFAT